MATGIVSVALSIDGQHTASRILLVLTAALWIALGLLLAGHALLDRSRIARGARSPGR
jgi:hypothetical protein